MKSLFVSIMILGVLTSWGQEKAPYQWPIQGARAGDNILSKPQDYIRSDGDIPELNFCNLYIGAPEGTTVVSPVDGTITFFVIRYTPRLKAAYSFGFDPGISFDQALKKIHKEMDLTSMDPRYLGGNLTIKSSDGKVISISGLTGDQIFKTGQKIKRGEAIGRVGYSYFKLKKPCIDISIDGHVVEDPMTPFGLKSSFIPYADIKPILSITKQQAIQDFTIYINSLKEAYPGLYNVATKEELEKYVQRTIADLNAGSETIRHSKFVELIYDVVSKIHDSHIYLHSTTPTEGQKTASYQPQILMGIINDTLICTNATKPYANLIGKQITHVNSLTVDSIKKVIISRASGYDSKVEGYKDYLLASNGFKEIFNDGLYNMKVRFADDKEVAIPGANLKDGWPKYVRDWKNFTRINRHSKGYSCNDIDEQTAYLGITSFNLNQVQTEDIARFIDSISSKKNLIIDLRNNFGGDANVLSKLYSYIAGDPCTINSYSRVTKKGKFDCLMKHSNNYADITTDIFPDYKAEEGKDGFYQRPESQHQIVADSTLNFKGRVYVLINENSVSAATLFPAMLVRSHRGVVVGRETRTAYHFMNALKFAEIQLPSSQISITIPLVECVFDTVVNTRVPYGRGVIPDYNVPITTEELTFINGDAVLNHTLDLIKHNKYLSDENPFEQTDEIVAGINKPNT